MGADRTKWTTMHFVLSAVAVSQMSLPVRCRNGPFLLTHVSLTASLRWVHKQASCGCRAAFPQCFAGLLAPGLIYFVSRVLLSSCILGSALVHQPLAWWTVVGILRMACLSVCLFVSTYVCVGVCTTNQPSQTCQSGMDTPF